jgi:SAM-dependent methyltransferase
MAHKEQRQFCESVKSKFPDYFKNKKVLDIGSLDINGSNRDLFENCDYTGIDVAEGKNVDHVSIGHLFDAPNETYDVIISTEVFEHDMFYEKTVKNVMRMLKPDGLFLFTCAAPGRPEHGTVRQGQWCAPLLLQISEEWAGYYKNLIPEDFKKIPKFNETFEQHYFEIKDTNIEIPSDLYFWGLKKN